MALARRGLPVRSFARLQPPLEVPDLLAIQRESYQWFLREGIREVLEEFSPIEDFTGTRYALYFDDYAIGEPTYTEAQCREEGHTYQAPLTIRARLVHRQTDVELEQTLKFGEIPIMTPRGTFIINGAERVVVTQLVRSPGAYFNLEPDPTTGRRLGVGKIIPTRGAWLEFETTSKDLLIARIDRKRKVPVTTLLRAIGFVDDEEIMALFADVDTAPDHRYIASTLEKDPLSTDSVLRDVEPQEPPRPDSRSPEKQREYERKRAEYERKREEFRRDLRAMWEKTWPEKDANGQPVRPYQEEQARRLAAARLVFYSRVRPGEPLSLANANAVLEALFFNPRRYDLGMAGRYKLNRILPKPLLPEGKHRTLTRDDIVAAVRCLIQVNNGAYPEDDIDDLANRRVRTVGEAVQNALRLGFLRLERAVKERMSSQEEKEGASPQAFVNYRPVQAVIREFFGGSQLAQFMDQTNPLAELTHKRRLSALGPGGLSRERAGFEVRDVHHSHYGRICPIETPEGPNVGLLVSLATYARINPYGFLETPYRKVHRELPNTDPDLVGRILRQEVRDGQGRVLASPGQKITPALFKRLAALPAQTIAVRPFVTTRPEDIVYLTADKEREAIIAQPNVPVDSKGQLLPERVEVRKRAEVTMESIDRVDYMDVSPMQVFSVSAALIPFLEHDDANRALMGSNMQRQAVPLLSPEAPLVGTGMERRVALDSGQVAVAQADGIVTFVDSTQVQITRPDGTVDTYPLVKFLRTNQSTCFNQRPIVHLGQQVRKGDPLADSSSTDQGYLALGHNVLVAFMSWEGYNYEDAVIVSEALVRQDKFTSVHIEEFECEARQTKQGDEEITADIPQVGEEARAHLDENGVVRIGAEVGPGDILVGKVTPKGEQEPTGEEKLLRAIFGEKARDVKDTSLRLRHGEWGKVIHTLVLDGKKKHSLPPGVLKVVKVWVAQVRKLSVGDKMAGRHGNKGVISKVTPIEDMPFLEDGTPVELILNPIGVPSRMNLGQVMETHLGWVAGNLGFRALSPVFAGARDVDIEDGLARVWFIHAAHALERRNLDEPKVDWEKVRAWLQERGYSLERLFDPQVQGEAREACLRLWLREDPYARRYTQVDPATADYPTLLDEARRLNREHRLAPPILGKVRLRDGRTGDYFDQPVTVGYIYMMKLIHLVEDKIHARSTGPYSLITQQPLGGKAQFGGQRFGEMEVWALEAYSAAHNLQEMLTIKSDDVSGRQRAYEAIIKGEDVVEPGVPESFQVLVKELQALGLSVELLSEAEEALPAPPRTDGASASQGAAPAAAP
ncbi:MAG: DNA-directed RNA polymerase subunit beta [Chloroflexota bacterium]|nr:DNA-directed RNA polymerase subunit beta [Chloroflexota bacterium]